ncbi:hypothetical protein ACP4OV_027015 [Aristida adscensionis]
MAGAGADSDDALAALREQLALASSAAISACDLDHAFQLQLAEALQASLRAHSDHSPNAAAAAASPSSSSSSSSSMLLEPSSDAAYALALQAADLALAERNRCAAQACRARSAAAARAAAHDALFARELAAVPDDTWARDGARLARPLDLESPPPAPPGPLFRVLFKGMASGEVVGPRDRDPGVAVLAVAVCAPHGEVLLAAQRSRSRPRRRRRRRRIQRARRWRRWRSWRAWTRRLDWASAASRSSPITRCCTTMMLGVWRPTGEKMVKLINQAVSVQKNFEQCEISLVQQSQVSYVLKLAREAMDFSIAKRETCSICMEDADITKIHVVEGCAHRFCFPCMKEHVKVKVHHGMPPDCPQNGCTTKLTVEGSKVFLPPPLLEIMVQRIREAQIPPDQKVYCPYPKCSALMSLHDVIHPQESCSENTVAYTATLRRCVKCRGSFCINCKVPWHDMMKCSYYKRMQARPEEARLQDLAEKRLWRQSVAMNSATHVEKNGRIRKLPARASCGIYAISSVNRMIITLSPYVPAVANFKAPIDDPSTPCH